MPSCAANGCVHRSNVDTKRGITFHKFPKDPYLRELWVKAIKREDYEPTYCSVLCSVHFKEEFIDRTSLSCVRLREGAVPTIFFPFRKNMKKGKLKRKVREEPVLIEPSSSTLESDKPVPATDGLPDENIPDKSLENSNDINLDNGGGIKRRKRKCLLRVSPSNKKKLTIKRTKIDENAAIYNRIQESVNTEASNGNHEDCENTHRLRRKRVPRPTFKIKEEPMSNEEECFSWNGENMDEYLPPENEGKYSPDSFSEDSNGSDYQPRKISSKKMKKRPKRKSSPKKKMVYKEEKEVKEKSPPRAGDRIMQLANDRMYFEFAKPKKKVILQINPPSNLHELKIDTLHDLLNSLEIRKLINSEARGLLEAYRELPHDLAISSESNPKCKRISEEVKKFATIFYFYSSKAFDLLGNKYIFPEKSLVKSRLQSKHFWPGFTQEAISLLKNLKIKKHKEMVCIMFDNINIEKKCDIQSNRWIGHIDFWGGPTPNDLDGIPMASEILLFTVVGINRDWKLPFGYFPNNGLSGEALQNIVREAIEIIDSCSLNVKAIVCEGNTSTINMVSLFGCNLLTKSLSEVVTCFPHPVKSSKNIHLIFSIHQSLDLLKKLLAQRSLLQNSIYGTIKYKQIELLRGNNQTPEARTCEDEDLRNFYHMQKILCQCRSNFSSLESRTFDLANELALKSFEKSTAASDFVADISRAFDLLNSRNPVTTGEKPPVSNLFMAEQVECLTVIAQRLITLEFISGQKVVSSGRWMSVMLFAFTLKSVSIIASELLKEENLRYLTTYRFNLDHSDMMLNHIQSCGDWEGVPTAALFREGYKKLFDSFVKPSLIPVISNDFDGYDLTVGQGIICPFRKQIQISKEIYSDWVPGSLHLADFIAVNNFNARLIVKHISLRLTCAECMALMIEDNPYSDVKRKKILLSYFLPSKFVHNILTISGNIMNVVLMESGVPKIEHVVVRIFNEYLGRNNPCDSSVHEIEEPHHVVCLIKVIIRTFILFRIHTSKNLFDAKSRLQKCML